MLQAIEIVYRRIDWMLRESWVLQAAKYYKITRKLLSIIILSIIITN